VGNRTKETSNSIEHIYSYPNSGGRTTSNRLTSANGVSFGYDNNGNTTTEAARVYIYNQNQRLIQVTDGAMTAGYTYNGNGQRVKKNVNGTVTIFHYSQNGQIIAESNSAGTITTEYVYLNGQPLAKMEGENAYYYHNDHLATPQKMTDSSGTVVWAADYKPFGEATVIISTITNNLRFPGQYYDAETGLHYNYYRDYDPTTGKFLQADPIGIQAGSNHLYTYGGNNPIIFIDPFGLAGWPSMLGYGYAVVKGGLALNQAYYDWQLYNLLEQAISQTESLLNDIQKKKASSCDQSLLAMEQKATKQLELLLKQEQNLLMKYGMSVSTMPLTGAAKYQIKSAQ
jgi:RHS repeat-associated protein